MVQEPTQPPQAKPPKSIPRRIFDILSGFGLATISLLLLGILTWLATLEQIDSGLYPTLRKYFHWKALWVLPEINGKIVPLPLPGGYWVSALLLVNLTLGGILRIRKGAKQAGVIIAHFGIIFMLVAGGVAHHFSQRGNMAIGEGETSDVAEDYFEYVVEVAEIIDGEPASVTVIRGDLLTDLTGGNLRTVRLPELPFDLQLTRYLRNAIPVAVTEAAPRENEPVVDGYYLRSQPDELQAEANAAAVHARLVMDDGSLGTPFLLAGASFHPHAVRVDDRIFTVDMRKRLWPMPFQVYLRTFTADFHPGTNRPASFVSEIVRIEDDSRAPITIQMNEPMRHQGLTFFQASYGPQGARPGERMYSVFEIVENPADKWPEYSLYVVSFGLLVHFIMKLSQSLGVRNRKNLEARNRKKQHA